MKDTINENKTLVLLLGILSIVLLGALYYYVVYPKIEYEKRIASSIDQLSIENDRLREEVLVIQEGKGAPVNRFELRKKLPQTREVSELLRSLQEAELVSESSIHSIVFNNYDGLVSEYGYVLVEEDETLEDADQTEEERVELEVEEVPETKINVAALPSALKLLSFSLQVEVQDYEHLLAFIREIEAIERIKRIEEVTYSQGGEAELKAVDADETITVTLQVTTFYSEEEAD